MSRASQGVSNSDHQQAEPGHGDDRSESGLAGRQRRRRGRAGRMSVQMLAGVRPFNGGSLIDIDIDIVTICRKSKNHHLPQCHVVS